MVVGQASIRGVCGYSKAHNASFDYLSLANSSYPHQYRRLDEYPVFSFYSNYKSLGIYDAVLKNKTHANYESCK